MKKLLFWKSLVNGNEYDKEEYENHGYGGRREYGDWGGTFKRKLDLPKDEYPFTIIDKFIPANKEWYEKDKRKREELDKRLTDILNESRLLL